jgi:hypothetical protein
MHVPRKIRQLVTDLERAGFVLIPVGPVGKVRTGTSGTHEVQAPLF